MMQACVLNYGRTVREAKEIAAAHVQELSKMRTPLFGKMQVFRGVIVLGSVGTEVYEVHTTRLPMAEHLVVRIDAHAGRVLSVRNRIIH